MRPKLVVFARAPQPGMVKTRLAPAIRPDSAAVLHLAMVMDLFERLEQLRPEVDLELHTDQPTSSFHCPGIPVRTQAAGDLGTRLHAALSDGLGSGRSAVLVMGSDSPTVPLSHISGMLATDNDVVLGPASDGGFYAILCRRTHPGMFQGVTWSSNVTCAETADAVRRCGLTLAIGEPWYDVDTLEDLHRLALDPNLGAATRAALRTAGYRLPE